MTFGYVILLLQTVTILEPFWLQALSWSLPKGNPLGLACQDSESLQILLIQSYRSTVKVEVFFSH